MLDMRPKDASADIPAQQKYVAMWRAVNTKDDNDPLRVAKITWYPSSLCICPDACR